MICIACTMNVDHYWHDDGTRTDLAGPVYTNGFEHEDGERLKDYKDGAWYVDYEPPDKPPALTDMGVKETRDQWSLQQGHEVIAEPKLESLLTDEVYDRGYKDGYEEAELDAYQKGLDAGWRDAQNLAPILERAGDPRFHAKLKEIADLHDKKQQDYGTNTDPFANVRGSEAWGVRPWLGAMIRANDKIRRLQTYAHTGTLANEGVADAFMDLAVYALIGLILWEEEN